MANYLHKRDYFTEMREKDFDEMLFEASQKTSFSPERTRIESELKVQAIIETHIRHRYDVAKIFKGVLTFVLADQYQIGDLVSYSQTAYDSSATYAVDDLVSYSKLENEGRHQVLVDDIYVCITTVSAAEPFNTAKWTKQTENGALYYAEQPSVNNAPTTAFAFTTNNYTGNHDQILGWDKTNTLYLKRIDKQVKIYYSSADRTSDSDSIGIVDFGPSANQFPDNRPIEPGTDTENILSGDLSFIGFVPDATTWDVAPSNYFIKGDNRSRTVIKIMTSLALYEMHKLISPRNVPEIRGEAKDDAMNLLKMISKGSVTEDLPIFFDEQRGQNIVTGSNPQKKWAY